MGERGAFVLEKLGLETGEALPVVQEGAARKDDHMEKTFFRELVAAPEDGGESVEAVQAAQGNVAVPKRLRRLEVGEGKIERNGDH